MPAFDEIVRQAERATRLMRWSSLEEVVPADLFYSALCLADVNLMFGKTESQYDPCCAAWAMPSTSTVTATFRERKVSLGL